ncbi:hypothetical protein Cpir12675_005797 [Ceratocystis pirilliformis]|uniref:Ankyrin repeat protein n=1 Tax=Ceratocystis pirilliformis TaxID=259994 RepID=A0ABR3YMI9_9PEZI
MTIELSRTAGNTPLILACHFGRPEIIEELVQARANQFALNRAGNNILHEIISYPLPKSPMLCALLDIFDQKLLRELLKQRNHVESGSFTPVHIAFQSLQQICPSNPRNGTRRLFKSEWTQDCIPRFVSLFLSYLSEHFSELKILDASDDTVLHGPIAQSSWRLIDQLAAFRPQLLVRENACGKTPAEAALMKRYAATFVASKSSLESFAFPKNNKKLVYGVRQLLTKPSGWTATVEEKERIWFQAMHVCNSQARTTKMLHLHGSRVQRIWLRESYDADQLA